MRPFSIYSGFSAIPRSEKGVANGVATLDATGKIPSSQIPNEFMSYKGNWNASTNSPSLADGVGSPGDVYRVNVAGTQDLGSGSQTFNVGDFCIANESIVWQQSDNSEPLYTAGAIVYAGSTGILKDDIARLSWNETRTQAIIGGSGNTIVDNANSTDNGIFTGFNNDINGTGQNQTAVIIGGATNEITDGTRSIIVAGVSNSITSAFYGLCGGFVNTVSGGDGVSIGGFLNISSGDESVTIGGDNNVAAGDYSYAMGRRSKANHAGSWVLSDDLDADFSSSATKQLLLRFANGAGISDSANITPDGQFHVAKAVDGVSVVHVLENSQANAAASLNERIECQYHFGGVKAAYWEIGKSEDFTVSANETAFAQLFLKKDGSDAEIIRLDHAGSNITSKLTINQATGIGGAAADSTILDLQSTTGSLLISRMTTGERDSLTALNGMILYNTSTNQFNFRENSAWVLK